MTRKQQSIAVVLTLMVVYLLTLAKVHLMLLTKSMMLEAQMPKHLLNQAKKVLLMVINLKRRKLMRLQMETRMLKAYQAEPPRIVLSQMLTVALLMKERLQRKLQLLLTP